MALIVPIATLALSWILPVKSDDWDHILNIVIPSITTNTISLLLGVLVTTSILGVSLAWFTSMTEFPLRRLFSVGLIFSLSFPAYVMAFIYSYFFEFDGPLHQLLKYLNLFEQNFEIPTYFKTVTAISLCLFPYVYLMARQAFLTQGNKLLEVGQTLGKSTLYSFWRVNLKMSSPWILSSLALVGMETLADFGAVSIFVYDTYTTAIYKSWFGFFSPHGASRLSTILLLFVLIMLYIQKRNDRKQKFYSLGYSDANTLRIPLSLLSKFWVFTYCSLVMTASFLLPVGFLLSWIFEESSLKDLYALVPYSLHTIYFGVLAASFTTLISLILFYGFRVKPTKLTHKLIPFCLLGYAIPGSIIALAIYLSSVHLEKWTSSVISFFGFENHDIQGLISSSSIIVIFGLVVRFLTIGYSPILQSAKRIPEQLDEASKSMGTHGLSMFFKVHFPLIKKGVWTGFLLVLVESLKELPLTLMTRPYGLDTLSINIYEFTSEGEWEKAALPSFVLFLAGLIPVILLMKAIDNHDAK